MWKCDNFVWHSNLITLNGINLYALMVAQSPGDGIRSWQVVAEKVLAVTTDYYMSGPRHLKDLPLSQILSKCTGKTTNL